MDIQILLAQAMAAIEASDINKARSILWQIIEQNPDIETAWLLLAQVAQSKEHAISFLEQAQRINPGNQTVAEMVYKLRFGETQQLDLFPNRIRPNIFMSGISINNSPPPTPGGNEAVVFGKPQVSNYDTQLQSPQIPIQVNREQVIPAGITSSIGTPYSPPIKDITPPPQVSRPEPIQKEVEKPQSLRGYVFLGILLAIPAQIITPIGAIILGILLIAAGKGLPVGAIGKGLIYGSIMLVACVTCSVLFSLGN